MHHLVPRIDRPLCSGIQALNAHYKLHSKIPEPSDTHPCDYFVTAGTAEGNKSVVRDSAILGSGKPCPRQTF